MVVSLFALIMADIPVLQILTDNNSRRTIEAECSRSKYVVEVFFPLKLLVRAT